MRKMVLLLLFFTMAIQAQDNIVYKKFNSFNLNSERILKIYLPDSYEENTDNSYPIAILLDGEFLFDLKSDPNEATDLKTEEQKRFADMQKRVVDLRKQYRP